MNDSNINTNDSNNDDSINKYSNEKQRQYSGNNGDQFSSSCCHRHKTAFGINTDGTCCAVCCSYSPAGGADLSMPSPLLANCAPPGHSQPLGVDPAKSPLSRFDLILLRSFQAVAAPAGVAAAAAAASSSICSTTSSRQSSLVSTADQQQLLQSMEFGDCCSLSCCSISSVDEHQQHHRGCEEVQEPTAADDGTGTKSANANGNSNADADGDQLLLLSALLSSSSLSSFSSTCSARHGSGVAQLWQRCTIEEESIAEECGGGDGTASADAIIGRVNGNDCEDDDTGTDCGGHGEEEEKCVNGTFGRR